MTIQGGTPPRGPGVSAPLSQRRQLSRLPPKDVFNNKMFMVGGWTRDDPSCPLEQFRPECNEWRAAARMVIRRGKVAVAALGGQIYAVGGADHVRCYSSVERYNPDTDSWSTDVAPLSSPRSGVSAVAMDGYLYAIGGHDGVAAVSAVERYDPRMNTWSKQRPMLSRRSGAAAAVLGGHLYVMGGSDGEVALDSGEETQRPGAKTYNPDTDSWSTDVAPLSSPRSGVSAVAMDGYLYAIGGHDGVAAVSTVER
ncbi:kelch-like protein diablo [Pungitius pungitius]|uniref:kelch-like protein diablo n=1 Tax=Pungitius pungitius TaxID=134920 RepID=UPI002E0FE260